METRKDAHIKQTWTDKFTHIQIYVEFKTQLTWLGLLASKLNQVSKNN